MTKYVALLRGINVGGRIIKMADLRVCFEKMGLTNVSTVLQSGNVLFESDQPLAKLKPLLEAGLSKTFDYPAKVQVYSLEQLAKIVAAYPFAAANTDQHDYVIFLENGLARELAAEAADLDGSVERMQAADAVVYWQVEKGRTLKSRFATKYQAKAKYRPFSTTRNIRTLAKLLDQ